MNSQNSPNLVVIERHSEDPNTRVTGLDKTLITIIIGIVFFILALPLIFRLTHRGTSLIGIKAVNDKGCPTIVGVIIHAIIFMFILRLLMQ